MSTAQRKYLEYFYEISKIYRKSGEEKEIASYIIEFAKKHNLKYYTDDLYNVIIWKEATKGYEEKEIIGLQAHTDMVCEKEENVKHNFENGVEVYEDNGYLMAKGTSLGADNGIGVAYLLAILDSEEIKHPKIEAIFTTQEETTMNGVKSIDKTKLNAKRIISFDNFSVDDIWIGSASSKEWEANRKMEYLTTNRELETYRLVLQNFLGGHSGMDIKDEKRGNPIKIASEILKEEILLNSIEGGSAINVIPRECIVTFSIFKEKSSLIMQNIKDNIKKQKEHYPVGDIFLEKVENSDTPFNSSSSKAVLDFINDFQNGALVLDSRKNTIVSGNFAKINTKDQMINFLYAIRSNKEAACKKFIENVNDIMKKYEVQLVKFELWKGYEQNEETSLIDICKKKYQEVMEKEPNILGVQACLECEFLNEKISDLQYVALGTNIYGAHSVTERVEINSIEKTWKIITKVLEEI